MAAIARYFITSTFKTIFMASIEIRTSQNVVIEYELATLNDRFWALLIDLIAFISIILIGASSFGLPMSLQSFMIFTLLGFLLYLLLFEVWSNGQTLGKMLMRQRVVRLDGREPGLGDYLLRSTFMMIDFFLSFGVLGAMLIGSTSRSQRFGDLAAGTTVVRLENKTSFTLDELTRIATIDQYKPQYPMVKQLSEEDVLLLRQVLHRYEKWPNAAHESALSLAVDMVCERLGIKPLHTRKTEFLRTLIRDYIVLTR